MRHGFGVLHIVGGSHIDLILTVFVGEVGDVLAVGRPAAFTLVGAGGLGHVAHRTVLGGEGEEVAAGDDQHALAVGRKVVGEHLVGHILVFGTAINVVVSEIDGHFLALAGLDVVLVDVAAVFEDHVVLRVGGELAVVFREVGDLADLLGLGVEDEEVHGPVAVGEEVDLIADPHREDVLGVAVGDRVDLGGAHAVDPDVVGLAAAVVFPGAEFAEHPVHGQILAVGGIAAEAAFGGRDLLGGAAVRIDLAELAAEAAERMGLAAVDDLLAVGRPAHHDVVGAHAFAHQVAADERRPGDAPGLAAGHGNRVDFGIAVVLAGEGHGFTVGRDAGEYFVSDVGREFDGVAALDAHAVEVPGVTEDDVVSADGRESEQARLLAVCRKGQQRKQRCQQGQDSLHNYRMLSDCSLIFSSSSFILTTHFCISAWLALEPRVLISRPISWAMKPSLRPGSGSSSTVSRK